MFIKSNKLLILVTTLFIVVTNNSEASDTIKQIDMNNIEHSSSVIASNLETVIEVHHNNEDEINHNNLEHNNGKINHSDDNVEHNNNDSHNNINHNENHSDHGNNEVNNNNSEHNGNENIEVENGSNHNDNANNNHVNNDSEQEQNNNNAVALNIQEAKIDDEKKESFCKHLTTMTYGIVLLPMAIYGGVVSNIKLGINHIPKDLNNKLTEIRSETKEFVGIVCNDTMSAFGNCVTILCNKVLNIGLNILSGAKSYIVRKIWE